MTEAFEMLEQAIKEHRLGHNLQAEKLYRDTLLLEPDNAVAIHNLGLIANSKSQTSEAISLFKRAIEISSESSQFWVSYIEVLVKDQQFNRARRVISRAREKGLASTVLKILEKTLTSADIPNSLDGAAREDPNLEDLNRLLDLHGNGQIQDAEALALSIAKDFPQHHLSWQVLGSIFSLTGRKTEALKANQVALELIPEDPNAHYNVGISFEAMGQIELAEESFVRAINLNPQHELSHSYLGSIYQQLGRFEDAENSYKLALEINPQNVIAHNNFANLMKELDRFDKAVFHYQMAIKLNPDFLEAHYNVGLILQNFGRVAEAEKAYIRALEVNSDHLDSHINLGELLKDQGRLEETLICYQNIERLEPKRAYHLGHKMDVGQMMCHWDTSPQNISRLISSINNNERVAPPFTLQILSDDPELERRCTEIYSNDRFPQSTNQQRIQPYRRHKKIRIGYFSAHFYSHPVTTGIADLFKLHDREKFEIHAFAFGLDRKDSWNSRVREDVDFFHDTHEMSDQDIVLLARSMEIDIAVDLTGYTTGNRTGIFASSVATLQIGYIGFLGTMGASYYDYILADKILIPEENKKYYSEKVVHLPCYQVNSEQPHSPKKSFDREHFGIPKDAFVFCCFNQNFKITSDDFDSWAHILSQVKNSMLILFVDHKSAIKNLKKEMSIRNISIERLVFVNRIEGSEYWSRYKVVDLFLDTFNYSAGMTASDALRSGCPLVTCLGMSFSSRFGGSILSALDLPELITKTRTEFENLAIRLANQPLELKALKEKLDINLSTKLLFDTERFAQSIESAYLEMQAKCHADEEPDDICIS